MKAASLRRESRRLRKILELLGICPGHLRGDAIDLPEGSVNAESIIFVESLEMPG